MQGVFHKKLFFLLSLAFILFTVIGTLSHEAGHYLVAILLGYPARIFYAYTSMPAASEGSDELLIRLGGPLQTLLTGITGCIILIVKRRSYSQTNLSGTQWGVIFLSLFWLRPLFNFVVDVVLYIRTGELDHNSDEIFITSYLDINEWSISVLCAGLALIVLGAVFFKFIPAPQKLTFLLAGLCGGLTGFYLWMFLLGPVVLG